MKLCCYLPNKTPRTEDRGNQIVTRRTIQGQRLASALVLLSAESKLSVFFRIDVANRRLDVIGSGSAIDFLFRLDLPHGAHNLWISDFEIHQPSRGYPLLKPATDRRLFDAEDTSCSGSAAELANDRAREWIAFFRGVTFLSHTQ